MGNSLRFLSGFLALGLSTQATYAQGPAVYVNDLSTAGDVYTTAPGSDVTGNGTPAAPFASVERALAQQGGGGGTVFIDAGTYSERVVLDRNTNLQGAGNATSNPGSATIFDGGLVASSTQTQETGLFITASGGTAGAPLTIADLTIRNYDFGIQTDIQSGKENFLLEDVETVFNRQHGIYWNGLGGVPASTRNITFRRVRASDSAASPNTRNNGAGRGLFIVNGHKQGILIENSEFANNARAGIDINDGSVSGLTIRGCSFGGNGGAAMAILGAGGNRDAGGNYTSIAALIENNAVRNNFSNGLEFKSCTGTGLAAGPGSLVIRGNYLLRAVIPLPVNPSFDNAGIAFVDRDRSLAGPTPAAGVNGDLVTGGAWLENNVVRGYYSTQSSTSFNINAFGIVLEGSNNKLVNNVVAQCQYGIQIQDRPATNSLQVTPYFDIERNQLLVSSGVSIRQNRIDSCEVAGIRAINLTNVVDAGLNWLNGTAATEIRGASGTGGRVRTLNGSFTEVSSLASTGRIDYNPFLNSRTDVSAAAGFQPDLSFLNVSHDSPVAAGTTAGRLEEGGLLVTEGGTVEALVGTYAENATVTRSFTLQQEGTGDVLVTGLTLNGTGKTLTLASPLTVTSSLTLTAGFVNSTATALLILVDNATSTAGNAGSYVQGPMRKVGNDAFVFPLGADGVWARLGISAPGNPSSAFTAQYLAVPYSSQVSSPPLVRISRVEHWTLERTAGNANVSVRLFWEDGSRSGIVDPAFLRVSRFDGSTWVSEGNGGTTGSAAAGSVVSAGSVSGYGPFTFGSVDIINPLPVELTAFRAEAAGEGRARLYWATAQERNNRGFEVERATNGNQWQRVGFVSGAGTSTSTRQYSYLDASGLTDVVYYRLRQVDTDGKSTYSAIAAVRLAHIRGKLAFFPNPATTEVTLRLAAPATGPVSIQVMDMAGRSVWSTRAEANGQTMVLPLTGNLKPGLYFVRVSSPGQPTATERLEVR